MDSRKIAVLETGTSVADGDDQHLDCVPHEKVQETIAKIQALKDAIVQTSRLSCQLGPMTSISKACTKRERPTNIFSGPSSRAHATCNTVRCAI